MLVDDCISCQSVRGKLKTPGGVIYEDDYWLVDHRPAPVLVRGYLFIKLKRHCEHLAELTPDEASALGPVVRNTCRAITQVLRPSKVHVASWGEGVKHIHFHVLPRMPDMPAGNRPVQFYLGAKDLLRRLGITRVTYSEDDAAAVAVRLREELRNLT